MASGLGLRTYPDQPAPLPDPNQSALPDWAGVWPRWTTSMLEASHLACYTRQHRWGWNDACRASVRFALLNGKDPPRGLAQLQLKAKSITAVWFSTATTGRTLAPKGKQERETCNFGHSGTIQTHPSLSKDFRVHFRVIGRRTRHQKGGP